MKKIFALLLAVAMVLSLAACGGSSAPAAPEASSDAEASTPAAESSVATLKEGVLTVATSPDFAPYEFYSIGEDGTPTLAGFDVALAQYIADYMGLELEIVTVDFDGVLSNLSTKSVDLGMAGLSPDEKRKSVMDFSDIYYKGGQAFVTVADKADKITSMEAANSPEFTIGAQTGSIQLSLAEKNTPNAKIISMPKVTDIVSELVSDKEDAAFIETAVAINYQKNYPELTLVCDVPYDVEGSAIGVRKDAPELLAAVNEAIAAAINDGSLNTFVAEANELSTGEAYEGLLVDGEVPGEISVDSSAE